MSMNEPYAYEKTFYLIGLDSGLGSSKDNH